MYEYNLVYNHINTLTFKLQCANDNNDVNNI